MGDMREEFGALKDERKERREALEPSRVAFATERLVAIGCEVHPYQFKAVEVLTPAGTRIHFWPYTGYFQGGSFRGRGIAKLIAEIELETKWKAHATKKEASQ